MSTTAPQFLVWNGSNVVGCCDTEQSAKAYARRVSGGWAAIQLKITDEHGKVIATCDAKPGQRMKWEKQ